MAVRKTYRGGNIAGVNIPSISFAQYDQQGNLFSELNKRINTLQQFAVERGAEQAVQRAADYVAGSAMDLSVFKKGNQEERQKLIDSGFLSGKITNDTSTLFDRAVRENQINQLKSKLTSIATRDFDQLLLLEQQALETGGSGDFYGAVQRIEATVNGLSDALVNIDGAAALDVRATLAETGDTYYKSIAELHVEQSAKIAKNEARVGFESVLKAAKLNILTDGGLTNSGIVDEGTNQPILKDNLAAQLNNVEEAGQILVGVLPDTEVASLVSDAKADVIAAYRINLETAVNELASSQPDSVMADMINELYGSDNIAVLGQKNEDLTYRLETLRKQDPETYDTAKSNIISMLNNKITAQEKAAEIVIVEEKRELDRYINIYRLSTDAEQRQQAYKILSTGQIETEDGVEQVFNPNNFVTDLKDIYKHHSATITSDLQDPQIVSDTRLEVSQGKKSVADIRSLEEQNLLSTETANTYIALIEADNSTAFTTAKDRLRKAFSVPDIFDDDFVMNQRYLEAEDELFEEFSSSLQDGTLTTSKLLAKTTELIENYKPSDMLLSYNEKIVDDMTGEILFKNAGTELYVANFLKGAGFNIGDSAFKNNIINDKAYAMEFKKRLAEAAEVAKDIGQQEEEVEGMLLEVFAFLDSLHPSTGVRR
jgi:hypothetical protein